VGYDEYPLLNKYTVIISWPSAMGWRHDYRISLLKTRYNADAMTAMIEL